MNSSYFVNAQAIVSYLLESDDDFIISPEELLQTPAMKNRERAAADQNKWRQFLPDGFKPVERWAKPGHSSQFETDPIGNWKGHITFYDNGGALVSAYYKTPAFEFDKRASTRRDKERGHGWGGGTDLEWVPHGQLRPYWRKMLKMFAENPDVWKARRIPHMPDSRWRPQGG